MKISFRISILLLLLVSHVVVFAQNQQDFLEEIPFDSSITRGTLDNGLKYFIKHNEKPEDRVELRLVINAGSILEDEDQLGLAHFTEHMAFNGSKNFDKNELVDYLQSVGVKFGAHLNAYTSFDETVYILPIPSDDDEILEQGITILEDWASNISFDPVELDKERGIVIEEWRIGQGAQTRMLKEYFPVILKGSKYAERLPIGTKKNLEEFDRAVITRFYEDWYRPDLMAVIAVGDIDVKEMEEKIKNHFSKLKNPDKSRERKDFDLPDNDQPLVAVASDPEATNILFNIMYKKEADYSTTIANYRKSHVEGLFLNMINQRLGELLQTGNPPYLYASTSLGSPVSRKKTAFSGFAVPKPDDIKTGIVTMLEEIRRVQLHGFNDQELRLAKLNTIEAYTNAYNERDKSKSASKADELKRHFLQKESVPGITFEYEFVKNHLNDISLAEVNAIISELITEKNRVMYLTGPKKEGLVLPTTDQILSWVEEVEQLDLEANVEEELDTNLIKEDVIGGKVIDDEFIDGPNVRKLTLSNGAVVLLKETDFKNDEILFSAFKLGGTSLASDELYWSASFASNVIGLSGVGDYSYIQLQKVLAGKSVGVSPYIRELESGVRGSSAPRDLETLLQLNYLYFNQVRKDDEAFQSMIQRIKASLANSLANPNYYFQNELAKIMSQNHLRGGGILDDSDLAKINHDEALEFYKKTFSNLGEFQYQFIGNFDSDAIIPLIEKYLGGGEKVSSDSKWIDRGLRVPTDMVDQKVYKGTEPKSSVIMNFHTEAKHKSLDSYYMRSLSEVLDIKLVEILREEKSGVYGVGASGKGNKSPYSYYSMKIQFPCGPDNVDDLVNTTLGLLNDIKENGVSQENLDKVKEAQRRDMELNWKSNSYWLNIMKSYAKGSIDIKKLELLNERIENMSTKHLKKVAKKYIDTESYIKVVLYPES